MREQEKGLTYNTLKKWTWNVTQNLVVQSSIYKKVILIDECRQNDLKSFANAYKVQIDTRRKYFQLSFRVDATGPSSG